MRKKINRTRNSIFKTCPSLCISRWLLLFFLEVGSLGTSALGAMEAPSRLTNKDYVGHTEKNLDLSNKTITNYDFSGAHLKNCNLNNCTMNNCVFAGTKIQGNLDNLRIRSNPQDPTEFKSVVIYNSSAKGLDIKNVTINDGEFDNVNLTDAKLDKIVITGSTFEKCNLLKANLSQGIIEDTFFTDIFETRWLDLSEATIESCTFSKMAFFFANLDHVRIQAGARKTMFKRCLFVLSDFTKASIKDSVFIDSLLAYPWDEYGEIDNNFTSKAAYYNSFVKPMVNSLPFLINPFPPIGAAAFLVSLFKKLNDSTTATESRIEMRSIFEDKEHGEYRAGYRGSTCKGIDKIRNLNGTTFFNVLGLSQHMEKLLLNKGATISKDEAERISIEKILDAVHDACIIKDNRDTRNTYTKGNKRESDLRGRAEKAEGLSTALALELKNAAKEKAKEIETKETK